MTTHLCGGNATPHLQNICAPGTVHEPLFRHPFGIQDLKVTSAVTVRKGDLTLQAHPRSVTVTKWIDVTYHHGPPIISVLTSCVLPTILSISSAPDILHSSTERKMVSMATRKASCLYLADGFAGIWRTWFAVHERERPRESKTLCFVPGSSSGSRSTQIPAGHVLLIRRPTILLHGPFSGCLV